jgi:hypothetical protein
MKDATMKPGYDVDSAITFLLVGLGIGAVLALVFNPKMEQRVMRDRINRWRTPRTQLREEARQQAA